MISSVHSDSSIRDKMRTCRWVLQRHPKGQYIYIPVRNVLYLLATSSGASLPHLEHHHLESQGITIGKPIKSKCLVLTSRTILSSPLQCPHILRCALVPRQFAVSSSNRNILGFVTDNLLPSILVRLDALDDENIYHFSGGASHTFRPHGSGGDDEFRVLRRLVLMLVPKFNVTYAVPIVSSSCLTSRMLYLWYSLV